MEPWGRWLGLQHDTASQGPVDTQPSTPLQLLAGGATWGSGRHWARLPHPGTPVRALGVVPASLP